MDIKKPCYLFALLQDPSNEDNIRINVTFGDLREYGEQCQYRHSEELHPYYLSVKDAAEFLGIAAITLYKWLKEGRIKAKKFGKKWMIAENDLISL